MRPATTMYVEKRRTGQIGEEPETRRRRRKAERHPSRRELPPLNICGFMPLLRTLQRVDEHAPPPRKRHATARWRRSSELSAYGGRSLFRSVDHAQGTEDFEEV
ncbi:hypothetical protein TGPRC2_366090 [Toxoplasma gondii TgCatPRC2]|uniref:Uncharacterized protein n=2 Tax=Toxoplasma gondii TaxID=5811 RepID=A0A151HC15_TOXGO|nr:hypothetical protein TGARI_366090 [Toxoplasma gondii ARI]KYK66868.1 hypothetical protein TGPRC2_366090 [Toxoplasma gondii TgCatPRC2]